MKSEQINELAAALSKAQGQMRPAAKDGKNPHLGNSYATLDSIIEAARKPLSDNGLGFSQLLQQGADGMMLETLLMHTSGQWLSSELLVVQMAGNRGVNELQALGSSLTYMKRYALAAMLGASVDEDNDGNAPVAPNKMQQKLRPGGKKPQGNNGRKTPVDNFFEAVQAECSNYYQSKEHLYNALGGWPKFSDPDDMAEAKERAIKHASKEAE